MSEPRKIKILVVDDHPFLREGIVGAINSRATWCWSARPATDRKPSNSFAYFVLMSL